MANSSIIITSKNQIMSDLQNDEDIISFLDISEEELENDIVYKRLFPFYYVMGTQEEVKSYICVEVVIEKQSFYASSRSSARNSLYSYPRIVFTIICHQDDMQVSKAGISGTRIDNLACIIDKKYNGYEGFGYGKLILRSNIPGSVNETYRYRQLIFDTVDIDDGLCGG